MGNPHILVIPYPMQGHITPLMELSQNLAKHGFKITFVNSDFNHKRIVDASANEVDNLIRLVSIPDGLEDGDNRNDPTKLTLGMIEVMAGELKKLIEKINSSEDDMITCVVADMGLGWAVLLAAELGIKKATFHPASALSFAFIDRIPQLLQDGVIDENGTPTNRHQVIQLSPTTPPVNPKNLWWTNLTDFSTQQMVFDYIQGNHKVVSTADWLISNSAYDLEPGAFSLVTKLLPIGPFSASSQLENLAGVLFPEDTICLTWLNQQAPRSVIYASFGSLSVFNQIQFQELALGLEHSNRPFLLVVKPDHEGKNDLLPEGFQERVAKQGKVVDWAPQRRVLAHPSVACFLSHCGWNSTVEGVSSGVPFLCWPNSSDQFMNESYICETWKVGLKFERDESGIVTREEFKQKIEQLVGDENFKAQALKLKEMVINCVKEGGNSNRTLQNFIEWVKS
ncbi:hypothetical protein PTKIN_Ptkin07bG0065200 [Pterospermum kingtungense]